MAAFAAVKLLGFNVMSGLTDFVGVFGG